MHAVFVRIHLMTGMDIQSAIVGFCHAQGAAVEGNIGIGPLDGNLSLALPVFAVFYDPHDFPAVRLRLVLLSKYQEISTLSGIKSTKIGKLCRQHMSRQKFIVPGIILNLHADVWYVFHPGQRLIFIFHKIGINNPSIYGIIVV